MSFLSIQESQKYVLLTSWPTLASSPQLMGAMEGCVAAVFNIDGCGAMTTGD